MDLVSQNTWKKCPFIIIFAYFSSHSRLFYELTYTAVFGGAGPDTSKIEGLEVRGEWRDFLGIV